MPVRQLAPGVYYYFGDEINQKSANCLWVIFKEYVLVVDANYPWGAEEILLEIRKTTDKPVRFVFNTHYHHDHTFGNSVFADAGAIIVSSTETATEMRTLGQIEWARGTSYSGRSMDGIKRVFPSLTFDQRMVFDDGDHRGQYAHRCRGDLRYRQYRIADGRIDQAFQCQHDHQWGYIIET